MMSISKSASLRTEGASKLDAGPWSGKLARQGCLYLLLLVVTRALLVALIGRFANGSEFTYDINFQLQYVETPLQLIQGKPIGHGFFPPLFPLALWLIAAPIKTAFTDFYAMRITMCCFELLAWPFVWFLICSVGTGWSRHGLAAAVVLAPACWTPDAIMCQDEALSLAFVAAAMSCLLRNKFAIACLVCGIGVVVAKVYLLVALFAVLGARAGRTWHEWFACVAAGLAPIIAVQAIQFALSASGDGGVVTASALAQFQPEATMSVNQWALLEIAFGLAPSTERLISGLLALAVCFLLLFLRLRRNFVATGSDICALIGSMYFSIFAAFYVINPEYYLFAMPAILVCVSTRWALPILLVGLCLPWSVNFFYGVVGGAASGDAGRAPFVRMYFAVTSIDPTIMHSLAIITNSVFTVGIAIALSVRSLRSSALANSSA